MQSRLRMTWAAGGAALLLVLALVGAALGAETVGDGSTILVVATTTTFEDADGDGLDDDCDASAVADPTAAAAAEAAADLDHDGSISVSEAAQSGRIGGKNCNHGGYVSGVAREQCDAEATAPEAADENEAAEAAVEPCTEDPEAADEEATKDAPCVEIAAPTFDPAVYTGPGAFGAYVSTVAKSDAIGGKNCNHGGAVSEAVKAAKAVARAEREAAKAERKAQRDAAKAERAAGRASAGKGRGGH